MGNENYTIHLGYDGRDVVEDKVTILFKESGRTVGSVKVYTNLLKNIKLLEKYIIKKFRTFTNK